MTGVATVIYTLVFMGAIVAPVLGGYNVTVVTVPSKGPFRLFTSVILSCRVNPQPPGTVVYSWKSSDPRSGLSSGNSTSPNTTFNIYYNYLRFGWYFCYVYSDGTLIGVGHTLVETEGYIRTDWPRIQFFTPGETITLRVNISTAGIYGFFFRFDITRLTWFHNETEVTANCTSGRFTVNAIGTELNITNATSSDSGMYTVRMSSTTYGDGCDTLWLPPLEHYTAHAPVTYILTEQGTRPDLGAPQPNYHYPYQLGQFTIQQYFESSLIPLLNDIQIQWYHNGTAVDGSRTNSSLERQGERLTLSLTVFNASEEMDLGLYEGVANVDVSNFYSSTTGCRRFYYYYYYVRFDIRIYQFRVASFPSVILQYEPPSTSVNAEQPALEGRESTILTCSAHGGRPDTHNLTWTKDGVVLARGHGTTLNYNTLYSFPNPFGRYVCTVESLYSSEEKSVLIQEKASLQIQMVLGNIETECRNWTHLRPISQAVMTIIQDLCHCNVTAGSLQDSSLTCSQTGDSTVFTSSLVYSSDNGSTTASMLVDMLQTWLLTSDNISTTADESLVEFSRTCPTRLTPQTTGACARPLPARVEYETPRVSECEHPTVAHISDGGAIAGGFIGGLLIGIAIFGAIIGVGICILRWRADPGRSTSGGQGGGVGTGKGELEMKPNAAYETVHYAEPPVYEPTS